MATENKVLTLEEVLALPEGARVWVEDRDFPGSCREHRASRQHKNHKREMCLVDNREWEWAAEDRYFSERYNLEIRVWSLPQPPTHEELEKNPWEVEHEPV